MVCCYFAEFLKIEISQMCRKSQLPLCCCSLSLISLGSKQIWTTNSARPIYSASPWEARTNHHHHHTVFREAAAAVRFKLVKSATCKMQFKKIKSKKTFSPQSTRLFFLLAQTTCWINFLREKNCQSTRDQQSVVIRTRVFRHEHQNSMVGGV